MLVIRLSSSACSLARLSVLLVLLVPSIRPMNVELMTVVLVNRVIVVVRLLPSTFSLMFISILGVRV